MSEPGGERRNNPGNLRPSKTPWLGQTGQADGFCTFLGPMWGLRALGEQLIIDQRRHGCSTVGKLVDRWAPPVENNTTSYRADVAARMRVGVDVPIDLQDFFTLAAAIKAFVIHENGNQPYSDELIAEAAYLAGASKPAVVIARYAAARAAKAPPSLPMPEKAADGQEGSGGGSAAA